MKKHCDTCEHSYFTQDREGILPIRTTRQHCRSPEYNSPSYTDSMLAEDRKLDYCRFWTPKNERKAS